ncbi:MAG: molybdenum cofactor biosynthesis protein B [Propioniciclava sp.]
MTQARVITVSDRSAAGEREDTSGPLLAAALAHQGYSVDTDLVADGAASVTAALMRARGIGARLIVTTGGTGVGPRDQTPEGTAVILDRELPGVAEALRIRGAESTGHAWLSRGIAGVVDAHGDQPGSLIVNLAGSPGAARDGAAVLAELAPHILDQLAGADH